MVLRIRGQVEQERGQDVGGGGKPGFTVIGAQMGSYGQSEQKFKVSRDVAKWLSEA